MMRTLVLAAVLGILGWITAGCGGGSTGPQKVELRAGGATAPYPAYAKWITELKKEYKEITVTYEPTGSARGIEGLKAGKLDFAGSDRPLTDAELGGFAVKPLHFPVLLDAVVPVYNLPEVKESLQFDGEALAGIFMGRIKRWNDPALARLNPGVGLPALPISVVHRADGSGSTFIMTDFLTKASPAWAKAMGTGLTVNWPVGVGAEQNKGVAEAVRATAGSLGYVEVNYAVQNGLSQGWVKNAAGQFRKADFESMGAAADAVADMPADFRVSLANASGEKTYPISSFTYLLVPSKVADPARREALRKVLRWVLTLGQKSTLELEYQLLPVTILDKIDNQIDAIQ